MASRYVTVGRQRLCLVVMIYLAADLMGSQQQPNSTEQADHLVPVDAHIEPAYMQLLSRTLFISGANYARILVMPGTDEGEFAIAIHSQPSSNAGDNATVTCTRASSNLWYLLLKSQQTNAGVPDARVARTDSPIPKSAAVAVSDAIENAIAHSRAPDHSVEVLDGTDIRFSIERKDAPALEGLLAPYAYGPTTQSLHRLVKLLTNYCDSGQAERQRIAKEIEAEATHLAE